MKSALLLCICLLFCSFAFAQGTIGLASPVVANGLGQPIAGAKVAVCLAFPGLTIIPPCQEAGNSLATTYTSATLNTPCASNPVTLGPLNGVGCTNPGLTDGFGNAVVYSGANPLVWYEVYGSNITSFTNQMVFPVAVGIPLTMSANGVFTVTGFANDNLLAAVGYPSNPCTPGPYFFAINSVYYTAALNGCLNIPSTATIQGGYGTMGIIQNASTTTQAAGGYFQGVGTAANAQVWGINMLSTCVGVIAGCKIRGIENDIGPGAAGAAPSSIIGYGMFGGSGGATIPAGFNATAFSIQPVSWAWHYGLVFGHGATDTAAIFLDCNNVVLNNCPSQTLQFQSYDSVPSNHVTNLINDTSGNLNLTFGPAGKNFGVAGSISATAGLTINGTGLSLSTAASNGIIVNPVSASASSASNTITLKAVNAGSSTITGSVFLDALGDLSLSGNGGNAILFPPNSGGIFIPGPTGGTSLLPVASGSFSDTLPQATGIVGVTFNSTTGAYQSKKNVVGCTTGGAAGNSCASDITVTWPVAFADTNYSASCTGFNPTNVPSGPFIVAATKLAGSIHVNYFAITAAAASYASVDCIAVHD